jgi:uncharacterized membrane protein
MPTVTTTLFRRAPAVVLCALAAHAVVYRSLWPAGGDHGYLTWYTPLVAVLSGLSLVALPLGLALGIARRRRPRALRAVAAVFVRVAPDGDPTTAAFALASQALAVLFVQESLERSLVLHRAAIASFPPATWSILLAAVVVVAALVAWLGRTVSNLVDGILSRARTHRVRPVGARRPTSPALVVRRSHPLAVHGGLRAPPAGA